MPLVLTPEQRHEAVVFEPLMEAGAVKRRGPGPPSTAPAVSEAIKGTAAGRFGTMRASGTKVAPDHSIEPSIVSAAGSSALSIVASSSAVWRRATRSAQLISKP
jgi:hypothetical protein